MPYYPRNLSKRLVRHKVHRFALRGLGDIWAGFFRGSQSSDLSSDVLPYINIVFLTGALHIIREQNPQSGSNERKNGSLFVRAEERASGRARHEINYAQICWRVETSGIRSMKEGGSNFDAGPIKKFPPEVCVICARSFNTFISYP